MKQLIRQVVAAIWHPLYRVGELLARASPPPEAFRILCLHSVPRSEHQLFDRLLRYLIEVYGVITPQEAEARIAGRVMGGAPGKVPYLLSFDDGFRNHAVLAQEILARYGVKALFFICPGIMDLPPAQHRAAVASQLFNPPLQVEAVTEEMLPMSWSEAASLLEAGHTLGAHTISHRKLIGLSPEKLEAELTLPKAVFQARWGIEVAWFAPPWGDLGSINIQALTSIARHFRFCCSTYRGVNSARTHPLALRREGVALRDPFAYQKMVVAGGLDLLHRWGPARQMARMAGTTEGGREGWK